MNLNGYQPTFKMQYISVPSFWRNYYDIIGFHRDLRTKELWIKPIVPKMMMSPYKTMETEKADKLAGVVVAGSDAGIRYITSCNNFDYIQFSNIDFGHKGTTVLLIRAVAGMEHWESRRFIILYPDNSV